MTWLRELLDGIGEIRDLREAVCLTTAARDRAQTEAKISRYERDAARFACNALAASNVQLASRLERGELLLADADRIIATMWMCLPDGGTLTAADRDRLWVWLDRHKDWAA